MNPDDSWWHERVTRPVKLADRAPTRLPPAVRNVWKNAVLVVGLMFALIVSVAALASH